MSFWRGDHVRLAPYEREAASAAYVMWRRDTEYWRLLDTGPPHLITLDQARKHMDDYVPGDDGYKFLIRRLEDDAVIGFVNLWPEWVHGNAWIGIGIGESANRGKGYGSDAMRLILRFAFAELGLQRVSLGLWVDNLRARRAYENVGFVLEGRVHEVGLRDGQRWDDGVMSVSHLDWLAMQNTK